MIKKYKDIEFYINLIQEIIKEQSKLDLQLNYFLFNIGLYEKNNLLNEVEISQELMKYYVKLYIPNTQKRINTIINDISKAVPTFNLFLKSMFDNIKIPIFIMTVLHELGHVSFYKDDKFDVISQKLNSFDLANDFLDIYKTKFKINKNILYRMRPFETYADDYALTNFIPLYNILYKNKIVTEKINVPKLKLSKNQIDDLEIIKKYRKEIDNNKLYIKCKNVYKLFTDKNKKYINNEYLFNCLYSIINTEKIKDKNFKYLYDISKDCLCKNLNCDELSLDYYNINIASALFPEFLNKINNNENYELELSKF